MNTYHVVVLRWIEGRLNRLGSCPHVDPRPPKPLYIAGRPTTASQPLTHQEEMAQDEEEEGEEKETRPAEFMLVSMHHLLVFVPGGLQLHYVALLA